MRVVLTVPELPGVETLRRGLAARITGLRITAAEASERTISGGLGDAMKQDVAGHQISRGHPGYLGQAHVFRRQGLPCPVCGTPVIRTTAAGRATNFCPHCQQR